MRKPRDPGVVFVPVPDWPTEWAGWRFSRGQLVSPDGDRISPERLRGLLWRQAQEARAAARQARKQRVIRVENGFRDRVRALGQRCQDEPAGDG